MQGNRRLKERSIQETCRNESIMRAGNDCHRFLLDLSFRARMMRARIDKSNDGVRDVSCTSGMLFLLLRHHLLPLRWCIAALLRFLLLQLIRVLDASDV